MTRRRKVKKEQPDLTEGLMDLLREPIATPKPREPGSQSPPAEAPLPSAGEDIGQGPANPLAEVQLGMTTLAQWLRTGADARRTKELQRDVVLRLDEVDWAIGTTIANTIAVSIFGGCSVNTITDQPVTFSFPGAAFTIWNQRITPQSGQKTDSASPQPGDDQTQPGQNGEGQNQSAGQKQPGATGGGNAPQSGQPGPSSSGAKGVTVDLNDPRALQRSAWGNLPERTREQMQSRMVERFLPSYRDEIEAYFRALAK